MKILQSGGNQTSALGSMAAQIDGADLIDAIDLGRWSGLTVAGAEGKRL